ncbi:hypothetical protein EB809_06100 [Marinobacter sp. R17]|uniref:hypothetical protein n=1 Tax=Marinobacter sp. R17 TaxID=2484250 RepID=UPI000F4D17EC|nr:hypothetical protein [Marinobacter sp. R17]ROU00687.1 hypothetical protein EB809_06100 [Marinobacter sp. R17]
MNVNHLLRPASQQDVYSNGDARIVRESPIQTSADKNERPSVVYHGLESSSLPDAGGVVTNVYEASTETNEEANARLSGVVRLLSKDLGNASANLKYSYDAALESLSPDLAEKDWGFSISGGELTVTAGSDALSEQETDSIREALLSAGVEYGAGRVSSTVIEAVQLDRGPAGVSNGIGRYDVSEENFGDVVDLRQYLQSHAPGGRYGQHRVDPSDIAGLFYTGGQAMMDQIVAKAEESFARPSDFGRIEV